MSKLAVSSSSSAVNQLETIMAKQFQDYHIEIFGTRDEPLFKAKQIGDMLGIAKIHKTLEEIDEDYKVLKLEPTGGGLQEQYFVTEEGLYELLFTTKSDKAKPFRKWAVTVVKEIRKNGEYNLKQQLEAHQQQLEKQDQEKQELTNRVEQLQIQSNEQLQQSNEEKERLVAELETLKKTKKYEEIEKTGCNYTLKTDSLDFYRNGMSRNKDCKNRVSSHQTSNEQEIEVLHEFKTSCPKLLESCIHYALEVYRSNSGREFFKCKIDHIVNIVDIIGHVLDTCRSSYMNISRDELIQKILEKLEFDGEVRSNSVKTELVVEFLEAKEIVEWVNKNITYELGAEVKQVDLNKRFFNNPNVGVKEKGKFRVQVERALDMFKKNDSNFNNDLQYLRRNVKGWINIKLT